MGKATNKQFINRLGCYSSYACACRCTYVLSLLELHRCQAKMAAFMRRFYQAGANAIDAVPLSENSKVFVGSTLFIGYAFYHVLSSKYSHANLRLGTCVMQSRFLQNQQSVLDMTLLHPRSQSLSEVKPNVI